MFIKHFTRVSRAAGILLSVCLLFFIISCANYGPTTTSISPIADANSPAFSVIVLPDTQYYSQTYPHIFKMQTQWIADNKDRLNIIFAAHIGDMVNDASDYRQWYFADMAMDVLDGKVPYGVLPGNHDQPTELYNQYFGPDRFAGDGWDGGHYGETNDNNYQLVSVSGIDFIFMQLQFEPPPEVIDWADGILKKYSDRTAILSTQSALNKDGTLTAAGETLFRLLENNKNLSLVLCGHVHAEANTTFTFPTHRTDVLLADYQTMDKGGSGYLRILTFLPGKGKLAVQTYSPFLDTYITDENSLFEMDFSLPQQR